MIRRLKHLAAALLVLAVVLPPAAFANSVAKPKKHHNGPSDCASATCVYVEGNGGANGRGASGPPVALSAHAAAALARFGGKDKRTLLAIGTSPGFGVPEPGSGGPFGDSSSPGTLLAALDLGAGPIALFAVLLAGAAAFAVARTLRRRRASQP
ncbi:MAG: hypothetical protein ACRDLM_01750 [Gaiellaceae bacterium]